jgi:hypothetical protein
VRVMKSSIAFHLCAHIGTSRATACVEVVCVDFTSVQHPHRVSCGQLWQCHCTVKELVSLTQSRAQGVMPCARSSANPHERQ